MGLFDFFKHKENETLKEEDERQCQNTDFSDFERVCRAIYEKTGITDLQSRKLATSKLQNYALDEGICTTQEFLDKMQTDSLFLQNVLDIATVNETFFFREVKELQWLVSYLKEHALSRQILSLPCSSGEEVYSLLILLDMEGVDISRFDFLGYDLNGHAIERAKEGLYSSHSLHQLPEEILLKYFTQEGSHYRIESRLKECCRFEQKNVFELDHAKESFDVVLSRNMLIYFDDEKRKEATEILISLLKNGGIFVKGHADNIADNPHLENITFGIYKKHS